MPRKARIDAPGALHHIICRGIERRKVFRDDTDRDYFVRRLGKVIRQTQTPCYAWALIPNHFHLLLKTGQVPISTVMRKLLTGYAVTFNRRHRRVGHLFQNRYKSILCQEETYLLELVRYIHLNPLRSGLVDSMKELDRFPYCGHSVLMGRRKNEWQELDSVLKRYGKRLSTARRNYHRFVEQGTTMGRRRDLTGGGLIRSVGGWRALKAFRRLNIHIKGDERILGDSDFVQSVLEAANERMERRLDLQVQGITFENAVDQVANEFGLEPGQVLSPLKHPLRVQARNLLCYWAVKELDKSGTEVARKLSVNKSTVSRAILRGEELALERNLKLTKT